MRIPEKERFIGMDIGGTSVKIGLADGMGRVLVRSEASVCFDQYETPILQTAVQKLKCFLSDREVLSALYGEKPRGIGVSATGQIDPESGTVIGTAGHLPHYEGSPIAKVLSEVSGLPVRVENDANCALLGECAFGAAKGLRNVVLVTIGTGIGGGILVDGKLLRGSRGIAGEIGHLVIREGGEGCSCGNQGCLERYASAGALTRLVEQAMQEDPALAALFRTEGGGSLVSVKRIFDQLDPKRDQISRQASVRESSGLEHLKALVDQWEEALSTGLVSLIHIFDPELVLLGGGVSGAGEMLLAPVRQKVLGRVMPAFASHVRIEAASLGNDAGLAGAVTLF